MVVSVATADFMHTYIRMHTCIHMCIHTAMNDTWRFDRVCVPVHTYMH